MDETKDETKDCQYCGKGFTPDPELVGDVALFCSPACYEFWIDDEEVG